MKILRACEDDMLKTTQENEKLASILFFIIKDLEEKANKQDQVLPYFLNKMNFNLKIEYLAQGGNKFQNFSMRQLVNTSFLHKSMPGLK